MISDPEIRNLARQYSRRLTLVWGLIARFRPLICPFGDILSAVPMGSRVFDVGAGNGLLLFLMARTREIHTGIGVELSAAAVSEGRNALRAVNADAVDLRRSLAGGVSNWPDGLFDTVTVIDVLHHVPKVEQRRFFHECAARVRPGGTLVYKDMCEEPVVLAWANRIHDLVIARQWIHYVPAAIVCEWSRQECLELLESRDIRMLWYGHELRVFRRIES